MARGHKNAYTDLTAEYVRYLFDYDKWTGQLFYKNPPSNCIAKGAKAGTPTMKGHIRVVIEGRHYLAHRIIWLWMTGEWPTFEIDHWDEDDGNNRWKNLREATSSQNLHNRGIQVNNTSGFKGVSRMRKRWTAEIQCSGKRHRLGYFNTPEEAAKAYKEAAIKLRGEFAKS